MFNPTDYIRQLQTKIPQEHAKAQQVLKAGNKSEAQLCLTRRKLMENEVNMKCNLVWSVTGRDWFVMSVKEGLVSVPRKGISKYDDIVIFQYHYCSRG